ncbi:hypothetical protein BOX15_Mlig015164g2 [Macrostomum lignano]|uniref:WSC domain-containing protein n=3 Tax=Macrostomum lignano TaxID=282301 RepID=A0A1I8IMF1_9PLAT|nr:hypothetical protein BOX15_Mlig015164g2 [Macrostomum lignano]
MTARLSKPPLLLPLLLAALLTVDSCRACQVVIQPIKSAINKVKSTYNSFKKKITSEKPKYIGCYADRDDNRDIQFIGARKSDMTVSKCNAICKEEYPMTKFFGVQNGNLCFCGNDYGNYGVRRDGHCDKPCGGAKGEKCGGELLNSVYEITSK